MEEQIAQFRSFTGANSKQAKEYLAVTKGNVDAAVNNWFDAGDEPLPEPTTKKERPRQEVPTKQTQLSHHYLELAGDVGPVFVVDQQLKIQNWTNDYQLKMDENGKSASVSGYYNWGSVRGPSKCYRGRWYYEVSLQTNGQMRVGWATEQYKPGDGDAVGSSPDSWGWEGSNKQLFHDPQNKNNKGIDGVVYGENWANGDIIGCFIDFDLREIKYSRNGRSLGVAFKNVNTINALLPCVSIKRGVKCTINFGPNFQHQPASFYGLDPCASITTRKTLTDLFETYCRKGGQDEDFDVMGGNGLMALVSDLGGQTMNDPHLLLLCWRLRPKDFLQIKITEWLLLWSNEKLSTLGDMRNAVSRWLRDTQQDESVFLSFYSFVFDYIRLEKGEGNTVLDKNDAKNCWDVLNIRSQFSFYDEWIKFWQTNTIKGINKDTWMMLLVFSKKIGTDVKNFDSEDYWPCVFDDFVEFLKEQKK